jgi:hypothetical protein
MKTNSGYIGDGRLDAHQTVGPLTLADDTQATLLLSYVPGPVQGQNQASYETDAQWKVVVSGTTVVCTVTKKMENFGSAASDITFAITGGAAKVAWSGPLTASATATAATFKDLVDLLNEIPNISANLLHAPWAGSVNNADFIAEDDTSIPQRGSPGSLRLECLYRDVSAYAVGNKEVMYARIGLPEEWDRNVLKLLRISGEHTGHSNGVVKIYTDNRDGEVTYQRQWTATAGTTLTDYLDSNIENYITAKGSLILEVAADNLTAAEYWVELSQGQLG